MNTLRSLFPTVILKDTSDVKIEAWVAHVNIPISENKINVEIILKTTTPFNPQGSLSSEKIEVSDDNNIPVYTNLQTPKMENGQQVYISEMQMWLQLMGQYTLEQAMALMQDSLKRKFGIIQTPFVYIEN